MSEFEPIAIVGRACRLPGAESPGELWAAVRANRDLLSEAPTGRWRVPAADVMSAEASPDHAYSARGGYLRGYAEGALDPVFTLTEEVASEALADACREGRPARVGAVMGNLSFPSAGHARFAESVWLGEGARALGIHAEPMERFHSGLPAHRLAQHLGLEAGAYALDAACASSLYAIELACRALQDGRADMMLAGAVNRCDDLFIHVGFCALGALSPTGRSRPFHADADGLVPGEGAAFVALQRLEDARASGRHIYGVIRGVGLANDGRGRGMLAPAQSGQVRSMRLALEQAGWSPEDVGYIECHATGTPVGDATELDSIAEAYGTNAPKLIGSLKGNLGHLITAAGAAGLIKVLEAMAAGELPPSPHVDSPNPALERTGCRVLHEARAWEGPRRAAVSAFGFGGNDAHLLVEDVSLSPKSKRSTATKRATSVVVVAMGARVGAGNCAADFAEGKGGRRAEIVRLPLEGLRFPPNDLRDALSQQTMLLAAALEATDALDLPADRTGVFIGAQCDSEVTRYGGRWRAEDWARRGGQGPEWAAAAREGLVPALGSAGVIGTMPNIPANRISSQLDLRGPSYTIAAEELSGLRALEIAYRALSEGELDVALVGAVDMLADEPVAAAALRAMGIDAPPGDAALVLVLMREEDAAGRRILAHLEPPAEEDSSIPTTATLAAHGHPHAAVGLLRAASTIVRLATDPSAPPRLRVSSRSLGGQQMSLVFRAPATRASLLPWSPKGPSLELPAHRDPVTLPNLTPQLMPPAPKLPPRNGGDTFMGRKSPESLTDSRAPAKNQVHVFSGAQMPPGGPASAADTSTFASAAPASPAAPFVPAPSSGLGAALGAHQSQLAAMHMEFVSRQAELHQQFLAMRQHLGFVVQGIGVAGPGQTAVGGQQTAVGNAQSAAGSGESAVRSPQPAVGSQQTAVGGQQTVVGSGQTAAGSGQTAVGSPQSAVRPQPTALSSQPSALSPQPSALSSQPAALSSQPSTAPVANGAHTAKPPIPALSKPPVGAPSWDRAQLEIHAGGTLSEIFGREFTRQDEHAVQVRMPEPPLLLADRVTGIDATPGAMVLKDARTTGTVWTETDVTADAWYLHHGRMPAGVMIEAGQADLFLISYLGVDFLNRGERAYRLLGCDLTYHGALPKIGETLCYDIHVDGHANQGDVRLFFFHYDCVLRSDEGVRPALSVRGGQAGFFTEQELAESAGILWRPEDQKITEDPQLDAPLVPCEHRAFTDSQLDAFAAGDVAGCFGAGFERVRTHNRTPRIAGGRMRFFERVDECDPQGGPWGRGYLKATQPITPDDWFFDGHFKNDPCMPGTLMFEGCLQAMATYMTSLGHTLDKDGWRFEPVPEEKFALRCRGQVLPSSKTLTYEIFVEEVVADPIPTLYADLLCTVDGLKAFHARRMAIRLVPDWPLEEWRQVDQANEDQANANASCAPELVPHVSASVDTLAVPAPPSASAVWAKDPKKRDFVFDYASLLACAWGRPSEAFGPMYEVFDSVRRVARLPGPPYHFMSRVTEINGPLGECKPGAEIEIAYDVPQHVWYFDENAQPVMPFAVLLEAALQPCGWLASFVGSALTVDRDLSFRNLDGKGRVLCEVFPTVDVTQTQTFRTQVKITNVSATAGMIIESFDVMCFLDSPDGTSTPAYELKTVFGFFPKEALENQIGLSTTAEQRALLEGPSEYRVDLTERPGAYFGALSLAEPMLLMVDRITECDPKGGRESLGFVRGEKDVDPGEWFFKAHFFQDPVQPGSLGIEAFLQLLQFFAIESNLHEDMEHPRFEAIAVGDEHSWKYRGQVVPSNKVIGSTCEILEVSRDERGVLLVGACSLWVDGKRIYEAPHIAIRVVDAPMDAAIDAPSGERSNAKRLNDETLSLKTHPWLGDHRPTFTVPTMPMMGVLDRMVAATGAKHLVDLRMERWVAVPETGETRTRVEREGDEVRLLVWREARDPKLSRFEIAARATVAADPSAMEPLESLGQVRDEPDPYTSGALFHGPAFRLLKSLKMGARGATAILDAGAGSVPYSTVHPALLDAATHAIPHDAFSRFDAQIPDDLVAYPHRLDAVFHVPMPSEGEVRCEVRYVGVRDDRFPITRVDLFSGETLLVQMRLTEVLLPKGPLGSAPRQGRRAFLESREPVKGLGLSTFAAGVTRTRAADVKASDWLPGTVANVYRSDASDLKTLTRDVAILDHVAQKRGVHPSALRVQGDGAVSRHAPLQRTAVAIAGEDPIEVRDANDATDAIDELDLSAVEDFWAERFGLREWPIADLYYALVRRFVAGVEIEDPDAFEAIRGQSALFLGNHQTGIESLLFGITVGALQRTPVLTLAKDAHRESWLGRLIALGFEYPGAHDPGVLAFFDREDPASLPRIVRGLASKVSGKDNKSLLVHVEGTRQLSARQPIEKMSGVFVDLALEAGLPVVPVAFVGGLPVEPLEDRLEFPVGHGRQTYRLGRPILASELKGLPYKERNEKVLAAIRALSPTDESPHAPELGFPAHASPAQVARTLLEQHPSPTDATREALSDAPSTPWLQRFGAWLREA